MSSIRHPVFGEVDLDPDDECWETEIAFAGSPVLLMIWGAGDEPVDPDTLDQAAGVVSHLASFDQRARAAIRDDYASGDDEASARMYVEHHQDVLGDQVPGDADGFLSRLRLVTVSLRPSDPDGYAVFDYSIGDDLTQYVLAVKFSPTGEVAEVALES